MTLPSGETVTRIRRVPGGYDEYGDPLPGTEEQADITNCGVAPRYSNDALEPGRRGVIVGLTLYAPPGSDIVSNDLVEVRDAVYQVDGEPGFWRSPYSGTGRGFEIALKRVREGAA
jgi:hypothetical protein